MCRAQAQRLGRDLEMSSKGVSYDQERDMRKRSWRVFLGGMSFAAAVVASAKPAGGQIETFALANAANNTAAAPFIDMVVDTTPTDTPPAGLTAWGDKGAVGLQGNQSEY